MDKLVREMTMEGANVALDYFLTQHGTKDTRGLPGVSGHVWQRSAADALVRVFFTVMFVREEGQVKVHVDLVAPTETFGKENIETLWNVMAQARKLIDQFVEVMEPMTTSGIHFDNRKKDESYLVAGVYMGLIARLYRSNLRKIAFPIIVLALADQGEHIRFQVFFHQEDIRETLMKEVEKGEGIMLESLKVLGQRLGWFYSDIEGHEVEMILKNLKVKQ